LDFWGETGNAPVEPEDELNEVVESLGPCPKKKVVKKSRPRMKPLPPGAANKICLHNEYCLSLKKGVCAKNQGLISEMERCPIDNWWLWLENGVVSQIIIGPGEKKNRKRKF